MYGVSLDDVNDLAAFVKKQELEFPLLSDPDGSVALKYGVHAGRYARRVTFVLDDEGVLRHVDTDVKVSSHGPDVVALIVELEGG